MYGGDIVISPSTRIGDAVRLRPASLTVFYELACDPWKEGGRTIAEICAERSRTAPDLARELTSLPIPGPASDWERLPVHCLIDFLTSEHRQLIFGDFPAFRRLLEMPLRQAAGGGQFRNMLRFFEPFCAILAEGIRREEENLFPAILENDHVLRISGPDGRNGDAAIRPPVSSRLLEHGRALFLELEGWWDAFEQEWDSPGSPHAVDMAVQVMRRLEGKIRAHCEVESERLFLIARGLEQSIQATLHP